MKDQKNQKKALVLTAALSAACLVSGCGRDVLNANAQTGSLENAVQAAAQQEATKAESVREGRDGGPGVTEAADDKAATEQRAETASEPGKDLDQTAPDGSYFLLEIDTEQSASKNETAHAAAAPVDGLSEEETAAPEKTSQETEAETKVDAGALSGTAAARYANGAKIGLEPSWPYAEFSAIYTGQAVFYAAETGRKGKVIALNAGHGTEGGASKKTYCHPDKSPKLTGGSTKAGAVKATAVSVGMSFQDGTPERKVTLQLAQLLRDKLLAAGYDVLMLRDGEDVQLDNVARTVIANQTADVHISLHWDGDGLSTDKGCFYMSVPDGLKQMEPVSAHWQQHEALGAALIAGLKAQGFQIWDSNPLDMDLTQTSYSTIPSVDIELGNQSAAHDDGTLRRQADGLLAGIEAYFGA